MFKRKNFLIFAPFIRKHMKKMVFILSMFAAFLTLPFCGAPTANPTPEPNQDTLVETMVADTIPEVSIDSATFYSPELRLYVCEVVDGDTIKRVHYPVCVGLNKGQKEKKGDMKTPECTAVNPFTITEIVDASKWYHDFGDGRGSILSYGNWFMRLKTPGHSGIGIHGSTNNESSVPGRGSEGCIRLRNNDLDDLKENYAFVGMKVIILADY